MFIGGGVESSDRGVPGALAKIDMVDVPGVKEDRDGLELESSSAGGDVLGVSPVGTAEDPPGAVDAAGGTAAGVFVKLRSYPATGSDIPAGRWVFVVLGDSKDTNGFVACDMF